MDERVRRLRGPYAIVDPDLCAGRDPVWVGERLLAGGACALQIRVKGDAPREVLRLARALGSACRAAGALLFVNDRVDLAVAAGADGAHLGQDDLPLADARRVAPGLVLGISTHDLAQVDEALRAGADYLGFGPVFPTTTKDRPDPVVGLAGLAQAVARAAPVPLVAIGGIDPARAAELAATGVAAAAAIRAFAGASDPAAAVAAFAAGWGGGA